MTLLREAALVAGKDLRIEARSRVVTQQVLPFAVVVLLLFAFALDADRALLPRLAPGLFWIAVLLATLLAVSRAFALESEPGVRDALRLTGLDGGAIFLGKAAALALELLVLELVLLGGLVVLYDVSVTGALALTVAAVVATAGVAAAGTVYGALAAGLRGHETLVPLLVLPSVVPVMLGATRAFEAALGGVSAEAWPWIRLLTVFAAVYGTTGLLTFGSLLEET